MKINIDIPSVYRPTSDSLLEVGGITFRLVAMHQMTYDGDWESAGFYLYLANELIGHFWGYPGHKDILVVFRNYMAVKSPDYGISRDEITKMRMKNLAKNFLKSDEAMTKLK
jgi:hypothetical protein